MLFRSFISASYAQADKWKGEGEAKRDHVDAGFRFDFDRFNYITGAVLVNRMLNNNIYDPSLAELNAHGYYYDYATTFSGHIPGVKGSAQNEISQSPAYYKLSLNPFENVIASATGHFRLNDSTELKVMPYFWFGYGTGGSQEKLMAESGFLNPATGKLQGVDLNGDGDTLDKVLVATSSVTKTDRPGITTSITETLDNHSIIGGFWFEQAHHKQTAPMELINNDGSMPDPWLRGNYVDRVDGSPYQARDWLTVSSAWQFFLQDTITMLDDKLRVNIGVRDPNIRRDFTNLPNEGSNSGTFYEISRTYSDVLPQLGARYDIDAENQLFTSLSKNIKTPPNFAFSAATGDNVTLVNGQPVLSATVKPETSWDLDVGYRYQGKAMIAQATVFAVDYRDRMANAFDPETQVSSYINAGSVKTHGFELEAGNTPIAGWSAYGSFGYTDSEIQDNIQVSKTGILPTAGKEFPVTPKTKVGLSLQY